MRDDPPAADAPDALPTEKAPPVSPLSATVPPDAVPAQTREPVPVSSDDFLRTRRQRRQRRRMAAADRAAALNRAAVQNRPAPGSRLPARIAPARWTRHVLAWTGLVLFAGCLFTLLNGGTLPAWNLGGPEMHASGLVAVVIDPGHGGWDTGAVAQGVREKDLNLDVGLRVARVLESHGVRTRLTREDDHFVPLAGRVQLGNSLPGAVFVSIHFNDAPSDGHGGSRANGIETFYSEVKEAPAVGVWSLASFLGRHDAPAPAGARNDPAAAVRGGRELADSIQSSLISGTAALDRGIKERGLYVTRRVQGPAVLVEGGFVSHPAEARLLGEPDYRQLLAESIAGGIMKYLAASRHPAGGPPITVARNGVE